ncbi:glycoside hydrolase family protein [Pseudoalteromonas luteoviolacea]|uniref:Lysozyme n=1 Tax=Pseudoalteromonas luteoviolacea S4054 TaxID=1129367 RepID=A0A0F6AB89_9GAMM|nr:hypothetical protein [Pseudoalteromonas luteoviolacea]AOT08531.1 hypothetical protein S4054249_12030 [Pseudoalteromonas luteoviolacea]AOT13447.1 hypothetical protein S40542_12005 [Pseudoalteromonas luteoviolacea]AOT18360.1 hypothetical protein S4054_12005 [Pseudoalteromonas luteoviolacea]KKE83472.1 hypothetical protein N479_13960 [Pseudoalteromonas luteoviolacea S4054]KZN75909.1 hypothetical protein N481_06055 [Pseudoalteromonas luteoviolacea S4047-1]
MTHSISRQSMEALKVQLTCHEGLTLKPIRNEKGVLIVGVGRKVEHIGISEQEAEYMLENDIVEIANTLSLKVPIFNKLSQPRQLVLLNMAFSIGVDGLIRLKKLLAALCVEDFSLAASEVWHCGWTDEDGDRAMELAIQMKHG